MCRPSVRRDAGLGGTCEQRVPARLEVEVPNHARQLLRRPGQRRSAAHNQPAEAWSRRPRGKPTGPSKHSHTPRHGAEEGGNTRTPPERTALRRSRECTAGRPYLRAAPCSRSARQRRRPCQSSRPFRSPWPARRRHTHAERPTGPCLQSWDRQEEFPVGH